MNQSKIAPNVLTLEETAAYLRLPTETVLHQATQGKLPGRKIEHTWRFLQAAIDDWLRSQDTRAISLQQAGALSDDASLAELRDVIYQAREREEAPNGLDG